MTSEEANPMLLISCEHGGNAIPNEFRHAFRRAKPALESHRGLDIGALALAKLLAKRLDSPLHYSTTSRLLVDLNRTLGKRGSFSEFSRLLSADELARAIDRCYQPYRNELESRLKRASDPKIHVSIHSFTPVLDGKRRRCDLGVLFDPSRTVERAIAERLRKSLSRDLPKWKIFLNSPYKGTGDGITTDMRKRFGRTYAGIELEIRQDHLKRMIAKRDLAGFAKLLANSIAEATAVHSSGPRSTRLTGASTRT